MLTGYPEAVPINFGGLPPEQSSYATSRIVIWPIPLDRTTTYISDTRYGPRAILEASRNMETFDDELWAEICTHGIATLLKSIGKVTKDINVTITDSITHNHTQSNGNPMKINRHVILTQSHCRHGFLYENLETLYENINTILDDFIDIKGWKAIGNKISNYLRMSGFDFYENPNHKLISNSIIDNDSDVDNNINVNNNDQSDELTLF